MLRVPPLSQLHFHHRPQNSRTLPIPSKFVHHHHRRRCRLYCSPSPLISTAADFDQELDRLLLILPQDLRRNLEARRRSDLHDLVEIVLDIGRPPLARFPSGDITLSPRYVTPLDLQHATSQVGDFAGDNRAGISRTLHRISAIRNRKGGIVGLTCRVGRAVPGSADMLRDLVADGGSLLLIGPPGVGKTTIIRDIARMLADDYKKRVMIVDTSNEIGGDGDIPHPGIGSARRLQVPNADMQHKVLIEAVENHMPQVIIIDEIGTKLEALAASTIAQRGIQLVATAHGVTIENLIMNPSLEMLVGGIQSVTLGDEEASRRGGQKTILERKGPSTFTCCVEIISKTELQVHRNLEATVDTLLAGRSPDFEVCRIDPEGSTEGSTYRLVPMQMKISNKIDTHKDDDIAGEDHSVGKTEVTTDSPFNLEFAGKVAVKSSYESGLKIHLFVYGITETSVLQAFMQLGMDDTIEITDDISEADALLALHSKLKKNSQIQAVAKSRGTLVYVTKTNSLVQITKAIRALTNELAKGFKKSDTDNLNSVEKLDAVEEARLAIEQVVIPKGEQVLLLPRPSHIVSIQIGLVEGYKLKWEKVGKEPHISLLVLPFHGAAKEEEIISQNFHTGSEFGDLLSSDNLSSSQNGVARLPLLPE